jgi:hypothetical protein
LLLGSLTSTQVSLGEVASCNDDGGEPGTSCVESTAAVDLGFGLDLDVVLDADELAYLTNADTTLFLDMVRSKFLD